MLQGHALVPRNPPQPEDTDILEEPGASVADDAPRAAGAGTVQVESRDSEDSNPFRLKRSRPLSAEDHDALDEVAPPAAPSTEPSSSTAVPKRPRFGKLWRARAAQSGYNFSWF